jgi:hypothetical protein
MGNDSLHETSNDNGIRVVNFTIPKSLIVKVQCSYVAKFINTLALLTESTQADRLYLDI